MVRNKNYYFLWTWMTILQQNRSSNVCGEINQHQVVLKKSKSIYKANMKAGEATEREFFREMC